MQFRAMESAHVEFYVVHTASRAKREMGLRTGTSAVLGNLPRPAPSLHTDRQISPATHSATQTCAMHLTSTSTAPFPSVFFTAATIPWKPSELCQGTITGLLPPSHVTLTADKAVTRGRTCPVSIHASMAAPKNLFGELTAV
jgi:hypothetical protein